MVFRMEMLLGHFRLHLSLGRRCDGGRKAQHAIVPEHFNQEAAGGRVLMDRCTEHPVTCAANRLAGIVIGIRVNDERGAICIEQICPCGAGSKRYRRREYLGCDIALGVGENIRKVPRIRASRIEQAVNARHGHMNMAAR